MATPTGRGNHSDRGASPGKFQTMKNSFSTGCRESLPSIPVPVCDASGISAVRRKSIVFCYSLQMEDLPLIPLVAEMGVVPLTVDKCFHRSRTFGLKHFCIFPLHPLLCCSFIFTTQFTKCCHVARSSRVTNSKINQIELAMWQKSIHRRPSIEEDEDEEEEEEEEEEEATTNNKSREQRKMAEGR